MLTSDTFARCSRSIVTLVMLAIATFAPGQAYAPVPSIGARPGDAALDGVDAVPEVEIEQKMNAQVPLDTPLIDELGRRMTFGELFAAGRPVVLSLGYFECPMLCGQVLNGMLTSFKKLNYTLGDEYVAVMVSIDPKETATLAAQKRLSVMQAYERPGTENGWRFLTGRKESIDAIAQAVGFGYEYVPSIDQYAHGSALIVLTPEGRVSKYFGGIDYPADELRTAIDEAALNKVGGVVEGILMMLCYHYDPVTGQYSLGIMKMIRLGAFTTCLALAAYVAVMIRRERKRSRSRTQEELAHGH